MTKNNDTNSSENDSTDLEKLKQQMLYSKLIVGGIIATILILYFSNFHVSVSIKNEDWGTFGDFVGGILNPIIAAFALYWLITSVNLQIKELKKTNEALDKTLETAEKQQDQLSIQNFESLFFELLKTKSDATNEITYRFETLNGQRDHTLTGKNAIKKYIDNYKISDKKESWEIHYKNELLDIFGSYFRICYQIVKLIDNNTTLKNLEKPQTKEYSIKQKEYFDLFRATLTQHEIEAFFFNCLSSYGREKFKGLIEKYGMFEPLPLDLNAPSDRSIQLSSFAYQYSSDIFEKNKDWELYFKEINKMALNHDPKTIMKNTKYFKDFQIHLGFKGDQFGLLSYDNIQEKIAERINILSNTFKHVTNPSKIHIDRLQEYNELNLLKNVDFNYEMYMILKYEIDFNLFLASRISTLNNPA